MNRPFLAHTRPIRAGARRSGRGGRSDLSPPPHSASNQAVPAEGFARCNAKDSGRELRKREKTRKRERDRRASDLALTTASLSAGFRAFAPLRVFAVPAGFFPHRSSPCSLSKPFHQANPERLPPRQPPPYRRRNTGPACCTRGVAVRIALRVSPDSDPQNSPAEQNRYKQTSVQIRRDPMQRTRNTPDWRPFRGALVAGALPLP
jgi:hypothetical protein